VKVEWINPFLKATLETFQSMVGTTVKPSKPQLLSKENNLKDVSGVIGLSGSIKGVVVIGFPKETVFNVLENFIGERPTEFDADVSDAVGELANIIAGYAKKFFPVKDLQISLPSTVRGENHMVHIPQKIIPVQIPFQSELGIFTIEVGLKEAD
jgi:chemotaxis protein CheX